MVGLSVPTKVVKSYYYKLKTFTNDPEYLTLRDLTWQRIVFISLAIIMDDCISNRVAKFRYERKFIKNNVSIM